MTGGWKWTTIKIVVKNLGSLGKRLRIKRQSP